MRVPVFLLRVPAAQIWDIHTKGGNIIKADTDGAGGGVSIQLRSGRFLLYPVLSRLTIVLTPYDVLRMKNALEIHSGEFTDKEQKLVISE